VLHTDQKYPGHLDNWSASQALNQSVAWDNRQTTMVNDWLWALLRFSITLNNNDKKDVLLTAGKMDCLGSRAKVRVTFEFFQRTSKQVCHAISEKQTPKTSAILALHLNRIDDDRLRKAFRGSALIASRDKS
jgi:hypothetical protein